MLSYKITVASGLVLRVVISVFWDPIEEVGVVRWGTS